VALTMPFFIIYTSFTVKLVGFLVLVALTKNLLPQPRPANVPPNGKSSRKNASSNFEATAPSCFLG